MATDAYHYLYTGTDSLVIRIGSGEISANFFGSVGGSATDGKVIFYKNVEVSGGLQLGSVNVLSTLQGKANASDVYTKSDAALIFQPMWTSITSPLRSSTNSNGETSLGINPTADLTIFSMNVSGALNTTGN